MSAVPRVSVEIDMGDEVMLGTKKEEGSSLDSASDYGKGRISVFFNYLCHILAPI